MEREIRKETNIERMVREELSLLGLEYIQEYKWKVSPRRRWSYSIDFFLPDLNIAIDVDGEFWHSSVAAKAIDARKDLRLRKAKFKVVRIPERDILANVSKAVQIAIISAK